MDVKGASIKSLARGVWARPGHNRLFSDRLAGHRRRMNFVQEHITHPDQSYRVLRLALDAFRGARHRHRQFELTWIEQGTGLRFVGDSVQPYEAGDLVLIGPQLPHTWVSAAGPGRAPQVATVLQWAPELLDAPAWPELAAARTVLERAGRGLRIGEPGRIALTAALQALPGRTGLAGLALMLEVLALLVQHQDCMAPLASLSQRSGSAPSTEQDRRIGRVIEWVHRHLAQELTVEAAARLVHVSPPAFSRYFKREVGKSFTQYINDVRCSEASLRLRGSDKPVALVAHECGFATLSHFNRQFSLRTGLTPRQFRRGG